MRVREPMPFGKTASSSGDGSEPRAIAADPRDTEMWRLPLRKERAHGRRVEKGLYVKVPAPTRDAYLVAGMAILLRVSRNAVHNGASSRRIPCCQGG